MIAFKTAQPTRSHAMSTAHHVSVPSTHQRGSRNLVSALALAVAASMAPAAANAG
jgi:hypothetical protein